MEFEGIFTPIITPHKEDGAIDYDAYEAMVNYLIEAGIHCILVGGSTGEYYAQTHEERVEMMGVSRGVLTENFGWVATLQTCQVIGSDPHRLERMIMTSSTHQREKSRLVYQ